MSFAIYGDMSELYGTFESIKMRHNEGNNRFW